MLRIDVKAKELIFNFRVCVERVEKNHLFFAFQFTSQDFLTFVLFGPQKNKKVSKNHAAADNAYQTHGKIVESTEVVTRCISINGLTRPFQIFAFSA